MAFKEYEFVSHISDESILQLVGFFGNLIDALQRLQPFALADGNDYHDDQSRMTIIPKLYTNASLF